MKQLKREIPTDNITVIVHVECLKTKTQAFSTCLTQVKHVLYMFYVINATLRHVIHSLYLLFNILVFQLPYEMH